MSCGAPRDATGGYLTSLSLGDGFYNGFMWIGMKGRGQGVIRILTHKTLKSHITEELDVAIRII